MGPLKCRGVHIVFLWTFVVIFVCCILADLMPGFFLAHDTAILQTQELKASTKTTGTITDTWSNIVDNIKQSDRTIQNIHHQHIPTNYSCSNTTTYHGVEDLLCQQTPRFLKNYKNPCWYRSGRFVCLPYFQLIGMAKCGTTDLFARMLKHPYILHNDGFVDKEIFWWSSTRYGHTYDGAQRIESFSRYLMYFTSASKTIEKRPSEPFITGDGSPRDISCMGGWVHIPQNQGLQEPRYITPHLIKHVNPQVKLIVILRNPVDRLYSDFFHRRKGKLTAYGFDSAVRHSIAVLNNCTLHSSLRYCLYSRSLQLSVTTRLQMGFYYIFLKDWLDVFPRDQLLIFRTEDYKRNMDKYMQSVFEFLQVRNLTKEEMNETTKLKTKNITRGKTEAGPMLNETRRLLRDLYQPFNEKLAVLLRDDKYRWI